MSFPSRRAKVGIGLGMVLWVFIDLSYILSGGASYALGYLIGIYLLLFGLGWHISTGISWLRQSDSSD